MTRLELTWMGKGEEPSVEPRILIHDPSKDYGDPDSDNMLIHGDNLLALKALEKAYAGKVRCIYIVIWSRNPAFHNVHNEAEMPIAA